MRTTSRFSLAVLLSLVTLTVAFPPSSSSPSSSHKSSALHRLPPSSSSSSSSSSSPASSSFVCPLELDCDALASRGAFKRYRLRNSVGTELYFIRFGAVLQSFVVKDRSETQRDIVLGFDDPEDYCRQTSHPYFGAVIGRVANRISNCSFTLNQQLHNLTCNENLDEGSWPDTLHGGTIGFDRQMWDLDQYHATRHQNSNDGGEDAAAAESESNEEDKNEEAEDDNALFIRFHLFSPSGQMGFPGDLDVYVEYELADDATSALTIRYFANASSDTVVALTQHTYWNLNANINNEATIFDHLLLMDAARYLEVDSELLPNGVVASIEPLSPWLDFSVWKAIGKDISQGTVTPYGGYDNAFIFNSNSLTSDSEDSPFRDQYSNSSVLRRRRRRSLKQLIDSRVPPTFQLSSSSSESETLPLRVLLYSPLTGLGMNVYTDQKGLQFYAGNLLDGTIPRKQSQQTGDGTQYYERFGAVALEAQGYIDAVNHPDFPSMLLKAGDTYKQTTIYSFSV